MSAGSGLDKIRIAMMFPGPAHRSRSTGSSIPWSQPIVEKRPIGDSGVEVSPLALGTWAIGADEKWWGYVDDRESIAAIHQAIDAGVTLIDTAPIYGMGHSEELVGKAIQGRRGEVVLATKCGLMFPTSSDQVPARCLSRESVLRECEQSLRRLKTDVIDIYLCHWPDPDTPIKETMGALTTLLTHGKIRAIGLSNFGCQRIDAAREFGPIHALQPPFSMLNLRAADDLIPYCVDHAIAVLPYSPLEKGLLTGKFDAQSKFTDVRETDPEFTGERYHRNLAIVKALTDIATHYGKTVAQLAINWTTTYPGVTAALVGAKRPSQVTENAGGMGWVITDEDRLRIDEILRKP